MRHPSSIIRIALAHRTLSRRGLFTNILLALLVSAALGAAPASAITEAEELVRFGSEGQAAGDLSTPNAIATDPITGHLYVSNTGIGTNHRIDEFTPWGGFVKAFGWDVAPGAVNEQQEVRVRASSGQFRLSFGSGGPGVSETADLAFNASAAEVQAALNGLSNISGGGGATTVTSTPGTPDGISPYVYVVAFKGTLAGTDVAQLSTSNGTTPLAGGTPSSSLEARTRANGTTAGTGLESCTAESGCQAGSEGSGVGQLRDEAGSLAVDPSGDIYAREHGGRVQKFDSAGNFLLMLGGGVDQGPHHPGNLCTAQYVAEGDVCGAGSEGSGSGEFSNFARFRDIAVGADGTVYAADTERIEEFEPNGSFKGEVKLPGKVVRNLALDSQRARLYVTFDGEEDVHELDANTGVELDQLASKNPNQIAVDGEGNVFVIDEGPRPASSPIPFVLQFSPSGNSLNPPSFATAERAPGETGDADFFFELRGLGANAIGDVYVANDSPPGHQSFIRAFGPGPVNFEGPPPTPPTINAQFATAVQRDGATVAARINPHFWTNTRYYVEYGTGKCSEGGCEAQKPLPPGSALGSNAVDRPVQAAAIFLEGLTPGTTYHYRFVAESGGGGPVLGEEATFTTFPEPLGKSPCANEVFRFGFSAPLPDCRAYEMVSPVDKGGGDVKALVDARNFNTAVNQSSSDGERFTYSSYRAFADPKAAPYTVQFLAAREQGSGWANQDISPPQGTAAVERYGLNANLDNEYRAFSTDLCQAWLWVAAEPPLAPGASEDNIDLYRRHGCGGVDYETPAPGVFDAELQGVSADGSAVLLRANEKLTADATVGVSSAYYASEGQLHLLCILPSGVASTHYCSAGNDPELSSSGAGNAENGRVGAVTHAISADGSRVYWTEAKDASVATEGTGAVYLRENPGEEQSEVSGGECTKAEKACTVAVSGTATTKASRFLAASEDGSKALFEVAEGAAKGKLYEFELGGETRELAGKGLGVAAMSEDLSHIYFVSEEALSGTTGAKAGQPNLYLDQEGSQTFIATLSRIDVGRTTSSISNVNPAPLYHAARASADGHSLAFISDRSLTGYDNTDVASPLPCGEKEGSSEDVCDSEVYLYEAGASAPVCVSCNPSGARPQGRVVKRNVSSSHAEAASLPFANDQLYLPKGLSTDGARLFFNSYDALLSRDTNGKQDVYEWEKAASQAECEEKTADLYVEASGGCLSLISSGESPQDSEFLDSSADGRDAFFTTNASLLPQDPGLIDVYDARQGGGFPQPVKAAACEGEACQGPYSPPNDPTPASSSFEGAGNVVEKPARKGRKHKKKHTHKSKKANKRAARHNRGGQK